MTLAEGQEEGPLNLSANVPTYRLAQPFLREALNRTAADPGLDELCGYPPTGGDQVAREAVARWLHESSALADVGADELILCSGVMSALYLVLNHLHRPGEAVLCESATFFGIRDVARQLGLRLVPVAMDAHGVTPEALEAAARSSGARSVVLIPTLQNPTALTYPRERREAIARSCAQLSLDIIEDDIYGALTWPEQPLPAFQTLVPDRTFYLGGVSKILLPGLRVGWICCPEQHRAPLRELIWTTSIGSPQIGHRLFAQMVMADQAGRLAAVVRDEIRARSRLTMERLGDTLAPGSPPMSLHYWIPCPMDEARRIHADCLARGLTLTPPELPVIDAANVSGMRICIGAPPTRERLQTALEVLAGVLAQPGAATARPVV
ncbi:MAG: PLP-dependent aminotransferase family protein [Gammaproteobacteria bacterium]|nr:PLP-dependent aminotransferase family protein [Gammaproteobacteria bacterium]